MNDNIRDMPSAPTCFALNCSSLAAITDTTTGEFWKYSAHYCAPCYERLLCGEAVVIDSSRIELKRREDETKAVLMPVSANGLGNIGHCN